jgi:hypothetical protein
MSYCEDCGTKLSNGLCPNCQEEAVIIERFAGEGNTFSNEFLQKAAEQENSRRKT